MHLDTYLARIAYHGPRTPSPETLRQLHRAHLCSAPFENLDIPLGRPITLAPPILYDKIVVRQRGGFCYELNTLFAWLLEQLGFTVTMLSARVYDGDTLGPAFDHLLLLVDTGTPWLADVGFGDSFIDPVPLGFEVYTQRDTDYRLTESADGGLILSQQRPGAPWKPQYYFSLTPRAPEDFYPMCQYQQTSPASSFTRSSVCSRATDEGRITISNGRLIITTAAGRQEYPIDTEEEYRAVLLKHFGITLDPDAPVGRLLAAQYPPAS